MFAGSSVSVPTTVFNDTNVITTAVFNTSNSILYVNGTQQNAGNVGTASLSGTAAGIRIGNNFNSNDCWVGHFCELIIFNERLSIDQIQEVEGYLAWKWGLKNSLPSYPTYPYSGILYPTAPKFEPTVFSPSFWIDSVSRDNIQTDALNNTLNIRDRSSNSFILSDTFGFIYGDSTNWKFENTIYDNAVLGTNTSISIATPFTVFWVAQRTGSITDRFLIDGTNTTNGIRIRDSSGNYVIDRSGGLNVITTTVPTSTLGVFSATFWTTSSAVTSSFYANGVLSGTVVSTGFTATGITIGNDYLRTSNAWIGSISEIVIIRHITTLERRTQQRVAMEGYLAWKWGYVR
jgi:hypothetical protein